MKTKYFNSVERLAAAIHGPGTVMLYDSALSPFIRIYDNKNILRVSYETLEIERLEPPYDTWCHRYPYRSAQIDQTLKQIQNQTMKILNYSTSDVMISEQLNARLLSSDALKNNETLTKMYRDIVERYKSIKLPNTCLYRSNIPKIYTVRYSGLGFSVMWPNGFNIQNVARPKFVLIDYIVYLCSCIGIWFGLSALSLFDIAISKMNIGRPESRSERTHSVDRHAMRRLNRVESKIKFIFWLLMKQ